MPKGVRPHKQHTSKTVYHRQSERQAPEARKHNGHIRASHSSDGGRESGLLDPKSSGDVISSADSGSLHQISSCKASLGELLSGGCGSEKTLAVSKSNHKIYTCKARTPTSRGGQNPTSPYSSEYSRSINAPSRSSIFAGIAQDSILEDFEFEFQSVVRIDGDQCQVRWADSIIHKSDLLSRHLHGKCLLEYSACALPLRGGLLRVTWEPTWEPVSILRCYQDAVKCESLFEYGEVIDEQGGRSLVRWETSVIHESTLEALQDPLVLRYLQSVSDSLCYGYRVVAWEPMWVPTQDMEPYSRED